MRIIKHIALISALLLAVAGIALADDEDGCEVHTRGESRLCSYEPTTVGITKDSDDTGFMDFKISVMYQLFPATTTKFQNYVWSGLGDDSALYFAFTGRFGQYIETRDSSPVVGKRFNPKIFYRYWYNKRHKNYVDLGYAHESNGQSIDSLAEYQTALANTTDSNAVKDQLSRGWDYEEIVWKHIVYESEERARPDPCASEACRQDFCGSEECKKDFCKWCREERKDERQTTVASYVNVKFFLPRGLLQGPQENYNSWENDPEGKPRVLVNGLALMVKLIERGEVWFLKDLKAAALYETGIRRPFRYSTFRFELGTKVTQLPLAVWYQNGYNSDLAQYFKKVYSFGIQAEIGSF